MNFFFNVDFEHSCSRRSRRPVRDTSTLCHSLNFLCLTVSLFALLFPSHNFSLFDPSLTVSQRGQQQQQQGGQQQRNATAEPEAVRHAVAQREYLARQLNSLMEAQLQVEAQLWHDQLDAGTKTLE